MLEGFSCHLNILLLPKSINTVHKTNEGDVRMLFLKSKEAVNNVICAWSLTSHINETKPNRCLLVYIQQCIVECTKVLLILFKCFVCQKLILNLNKVFGMLMIFKYLELVVYKFTNVLAGWEIFLNGSNCNMSLF